eukprot:986449-Prorocentrum_minimum.AAC.2
MRGSWGGHRRVFWGHKEGFTPPEVQLLCVLRALVDGGQEVPPLPRAAPPVPPLAHVVRVEDAAGEALVEEGGARLGRPEDEEGGKGELLRVPNGVRVVRGALRLAAQALRGVPYIRRSVALGGVRFLGSGRN